MHYRLILLFIPQNNGIKQCMHKHTHTQNENLSKQVINLSHSSKSIAFTQIDKIQHKAKPNKKYKKNIIEFIIYWPNTLDHGAYFGVKLT